jgi:hypothetical protein
MRTSPSVLIDGECPTTSNCFLTNGTAKGLLNARTPKNMRGIAIQNASHSMPY